MRLSSMQRAIGRFALVVVGICALASSTFALDPPHDAPPGPSNCNDCHNTHGAAGFFLINQQYMVQGAQEAVAFGRMLDKLLAASDGLH